MGQVEKGIRRTAKVMSCAFGGVYGEVAEVHIISTRRRDSQWVKLLAARIQEVILETRLESFHGDKRRTNGRKPVADAPPAP